MLLINFKTYTQALGPNALRLAKELQTTAVEFPNVEVGLAPPSFDLAKVSDSVKVPIWAQHVDPAGEGQFTGHLSPKNAIEAGAIGTFLNHSEHQLGEGDIQKTLKLARNAGLKVLIFANSPQKVSEFKELNPDYLAYEPQELIGGKISVTSAKPEVISQAVEKSGNIPLLIGAGVHKKEDISTALSLGAVGAVVASAVVKAQNPSEVFSNLLSGF